MRTAQNIVTALVASALGVGCGAKTGLDTPDVFHDVADVHDAVDVPPDVPRPPLQICVVPTDANTPISAALDIAPTLAVADVLFMVDRTGSMTDSIANIRDGLTTVVVPGLLRAIPDLHLGLVTFADFPIYPYGEPSDIPFTLERPLSNQFSALQGSIRNIVAQGGGDNPEAHVAALYAVATGEGLPPFIPASGGCPSVGIGYPCFRPRAQPVIIMCTDAPFHNGPSRAGVTASNAYDPLAFAPNPAPHTYDEMLVQLNNRLHPHFIGINNGGANNPQSSHDDLAQLARDTNTIGMDGQPIVFDINEDGSGLSDDIVTAVERLTSEVPFDVSARPIDLDQQGGSRLITAIQPVSANPMNHIARLDATTFYTVIPGTHLSFSVVVDPTRATPMAREQRLPVRIQFYGDGRPTLGYEDIVIVIPAMGQMGCQ
jgi:hypothetical protein